MCGREIPSRLQGGELKVGPEVYLASQLTETSSRFPAHVEELRAFLEKEKLPVPSPDAIPVVAARLDSDSRFRADVGSLLRATLYRERERVGPEDLLGILVTAAAGTKHDLKSDTETAAIREMLRFVMQSRRATFRVDSDAESDSSEAEIREPEVREPVAVGATAGKAALLEAEPVLARRLRSRLDAAAEPVQARIELNADGATRESGLTEKFAAIADAERRGPRDREAGDLVLQPTEQARSGPELPAVRTSGLFAAHMEPEPVRWRAHPAWIAGVVCLVLGVGVGMVMHRVVSAAEMRAVAHVASTSNNAKPTAPLGKSAGTATAARTLNAAVARNGSEASAQPTAHGSAGGAGVTESPVETAQMASLAENSRAGVQPGPLEGRATPPPAVQRASGAAAPAGSPGAPTLKSSAVPVTVVKQVVTAWRDPEDTDADPPKSTAATTSIVPRASAGVMPANVIFSPAPEYPGAASVAGVHGQVTVRAVVDPDGNVIYARAVTGPAMLRDAAAEAVHKWRYRPLIYNGNAIAVTTVAILDFKLAK